MLLAVVLGYYVGRMKTLVCPHCKTDVSDRARMCAGCGAEIVRGASRRERAWIGLAFAVLAVPLLGLILRALEIARGTPPFPAPRSEATLFFVVGLIGFFVCAYLLGKGMARILWRSRIRFFRCYRHQ